MGNNTGKIMGNENGKRSWQAIVGNNSRKQKPETLMENTCETKTGNSNGTLKTIKGVRKQERATIIRKKNGTHEQTT